MKNLLLISTILFTIFSASANESVGRTYIVNTDGTVTFLNRVIPKLDETGRTYIVNEDGTVEFLDRVIQDLDLKLDALEEFKIDIENHLTKLN